ncbi:hypothetical protein ACLKA6_006310 [Drosophila palustris]
MPQSRVNGDVVVDVDVATASGSKDLLLLTVSCIVVTLMANNNLVPKLHLHLINLGLESSLGMPLAQLLGPGLENGDSRLVRIA